MRWLVGWLVFGGVVACGDSTSPPGPPHGRIWLLAGGAEMPAVNTTVQVLLPDDTQGCQSDEIIDGCRVRHGCNRIYPEAYGAGALTFGTTPVTRVPAGATVFSTDATLGPGAPVTVSAEDGGVPGFSTTFDAPVQAIITPGCDAEPVPAGQPLTLSWTGQDTGILRLEAFAGIDGDFTFLDCDLDAAPGSGTVSAAALAAAGGGLVRLYSMQVADVTVDDWTIEVGVGFDAIFPDGTFAQGSVAVLPP